MKNVPGINLKEIQHLKHRIDYLALGHFHKQFVLENWIYNPGSSEASCAMDNSFKRGIFLVDISKRDEDFVKRVKMIRLTNRKYIWETIYLNCSMKSKKEVETFVIEKLKSSLKYLNYDLHPSIPNMPILYLILKGIEPDNSCKISEKDLKTKICEIFPVVDVRIYQKFVQSLKTLDNYILAKNL